MDNFILELIGKLLFPLFLVAVLSSVMGIRAESILMPVFGVFGMVLKVSFQLALMFLKMVCGGAMLAIARLLNAR